jgi:hypothetical protein
VGFKKYFVVLASISLVVALFSGCEDDSFDRVFLAEDDEGDELDELRDIDTAIRQEGQATRVEINQEGDQIQAEINNEGTDLENAIRGNPSSPTPSPPQNPSTPLPPSGGPCAGGFLWKPVSDVTGNLVVLFPSSSNPTRVNVNGENGQGVGRTNGNRPTFRFSKPGCAYGNNIVIDTNEGVCGVANGCNRTER